ncbi:MAG: AAA family ATPase, partial [Candidatus Saccharimonadales bacterium]
MLKVTPLTAGDRPKIKPILLSLEDFWMQSNKGIEWYWEGILPKGGSSLLVAKPKAGKSTFLRNLMAKAVMGKSFLNRYTTQGIAVYFALEENAAVVKRHFELLGLTGKEALYLKIGSIIDNPVSAFKKALAQLPEAPRLIAIDTLQKFAHFKDSNDYSEVANIIEPFTDHAREIGAHVLFTHHTG